jgi:hypothetical protein
MAQHTVEYEIKVLDKATGTFKVIASSTAKGTKQVGDLKKSLGQMENNLKRLEAASKNSFRSDHIKKYNVLIDEQKNRIAQLQKQTATCGEKTQSAFGKMFAAAKPYLGIAAVIGAARWLYGQGNDAVMAAAKVEKYNVTLKTMLGSTSAARDRMQEYFDIAKKTPFELNQVVEAGNQLQAIGRYSRENLEMLGDLAAASGKPLEQVMNAYAKLSTGQKGEGVNMFRDLLISSQDWAKATGKGVSKNGELVATTEDMLKALPKIMEKKGFLGMMAAQAETTEGKMSNLQDAVFGLQSAIGQRLQPTTNSIIATMTKWVSVAEDYVKVPLWQDIAKEKVEINTLIGRLIEATNKQGDRNAIIEELQRKYPDLLKNINLEKATTEELKGALVDVNAEYDKKIRKAVYSAKIEKLVKENEEIAADIADNEISFEAKRQLNNAKIALDKLLMSKYGSSGEVSVDNNGNVKFASRVTRGGGIIYEQIDDPEIAAQVAAYQTTIDEAKGLTNTFNNEKKNIAKYTKEQEAIKRQIEMLQRLGGFSEEKSTKTGNKSISDTTTTTLTPISNLSDNYTSLGSVSASGGHSGRGGGGISVSIQNLISGGITIQTTNLQEGVEQIKRIVVQTLMDATNEFAAAG